MPLAPDISIIVPVYNGADRLTASLQSLLDQQDVTLEIIVVNDASTDGTDVLIDHLAQKYAAIVPVHLPINLGVHEARLAGITEARADWIGFLDADDFARPQMFSKMLQAGQLARADIVICSSDRVDDTRKRIAPKLHLRRSQLVEADIFARFCQLEFGTGMLWNKIFRRTLIWPYRTLHFPWRQNINEDLILNLACFQQADRIFLMRDILHEYVFRKSSATSRMQDHQAYVDTFRACAVALAVLPDLDAKRRSMVVDLYRRQLGFAAYCVARSVDLGAHEAELAEAVEVIYLHSPTALAMLSARAPQATNPRAAWRLLRRTLQTRLKQKLRFT